MPRSTLFPYTTLFRSEPGEDGCAAKVGVQGLGDALDRAVHDVGVDLAPEFRHRAAADDADRVEAAPGEDRKSTRLNSSHLVISYAVVCLKKKKIEIGT